MWVYVTLLCWGGGFLFVHIFQHATRSGAAVFPPVLYPFLGLAWIASCTAFISLLSPICWEWNIAFVVLIAIGVLRTRDELLDQLKKLTDHAKQAPAMLVLFVFIGAVLLLKSATVVHDYGVADAVFHSDTGYYHAPSIRWIEEYGVVPGLGNLLPPLAIDYLWFQPCALFGFRDFLPQRLHALTGLFTLWGLAFSIGGVWRLFNSGGWDRICISDLYRTMLLLPLCEVGNYIVSDSGDEPAAVIVLTAIGASLICLENDKVQISKKKCAVGSPDICAVLLLICFAVGIKLSALPLMVLGALLCIPSIRSKNFALMFFAVLIVLFVIGGKVTRSVIISGYPVYPLPQLDLFHVDWKMPAQVLVSEKNYVASMARARFAEPGRLLCGGMESWLLPWLKAFLKTPVGIGAIFSIVSLILSALFKWDFVVRHLRRFWKVHVTLMSGLLYWFLMAPDVRFGYGFLVAWEILFFSIGVMAFGDSIAEHGPNLHLKNFSWAFVLVILFGLIAAFTIPKKQPGDSFGKGVDFSIYYWRFLGKVATGSTDSRFLVFQDAYPEVEMKLFPLGDIALWRVSTGMRCWDAPLPSTPFLYRRIEQRRPDLSSGFRAVEGSVGDFSGMRLAQEYQESLQHPKTWEKKKIPSKSE